MVYQWKDGRSFGVPAQVAGERLAMIRKENGGSMTPRDVVEDARPSDSPLHRAFEWDDEKAAEAHRRRQASQLIRSVRIVEDDPEDETVPASRIVYVSVRPPEGGAARYVTVSRALSDAEMRQQVLDDAVRSLDALRARYGHLSELAGVFKAVADLSRVGV